MLKKPKIKALFLCLKQLKIKLTKNVNINIINTDFLEFNVEKKYDLCIGNPPFTKLNSKNKKLKKYLQNQKLVLLYVQVKCLMAYNLNFI